MVELAEADLDEEQEQEQGGVTMVVMGSITYPMVSVNQSLVKQQPTVFLTVDLNHFHDT